RCRDRARLLNLLFPVFNQRADCVATSNCGTEKAKLGRRTYHQAKFLIWYIRLGALLHAEWYDTQGFDRWWAAGHSGQRRFHADVVTSRGAATNADALTPAHQSVVRRAARHGQIEIVAAQHLDLSASGRFAPLIQDANHTLTQWVRFEDAAVEQDGTRLRYLLFAALRRHQLRQDIFVTMQEVCEVLGHGRVAGIG